MQSRFAFYSKSADKRPGAGVNEILGSGNFTQLSRIKDWRQKLSNFYPCTFIYDRKTFLSAEHAFHYAKFKAIGQVKLADLFTLQSGSVVAKSDPNEAKIYGGKNARKSLYVMSPGERDLWEKVRKRTVTNILRHKFTQCADAREVLLLTQDAELYHILGRGGGIEHWDYLEQVRDELQIRDELQSISDDSSGQDDSPGQDDIIATYFDYYVYE